MNAKQNREQTKHRTQLNLALITLEKAEPRSIWQKIKSVLSTSDLDFENWQRLESKKFKHGFSDQRRNQ